MQDALGAGAEVDFEDRPDPAATPLLRRSVEIAVTGLDQVAQRKGTVAAAAREGIHHALGASAQADLEYRSIIVEAAVLRGSVQVSTNRLDHARVGIGT